LLVLAPSEWSTLRLGPWATRFVYDGVGGIDASDLAWMLGRSVRGLWLPLGGGEWRFIAAGEEGVPVASGTAVVAVRSADAAVEERKLPLGGS